MPPQRVDVTSALALITEAAECLDRADLDGTEERVEAALTMVAEGLEESWLEITVGELLATLASPPRARALARCLWLGCVIDENRGRLDRARARCRRAMELYARLRLESEELDQRAALELGATSGRLGATSFSAAHARR